MVTDPPSAAEHEKIAIRQQEVIEELFEQCQGSPEQEIAARLTRALAASGVPAPAPWIRTVAGELAQGHIYVVAKGSLHAGSLPTAQQSSGPAGPVEA